LRAAKVCIAVVAATVLAVLPIARSADAGPRWAPASTATIHPGVQTFTPAGQCTSNFVFFDKKHVYIGQAAHCSSKGLPNETNGCETDLYPVGTKVRLEGASKRGVIVYNSWATMQDIGEKDEATCLGNDFALVRIDPADRAKVNPSIPIWGGPTGLDRSASFGESTYTYGDSELRAGLEALSPKFGVTTGDDNEGWTHGIYTVTPGIFGDSGSAVLGPTGGALGVLSTVELLPRPLENNAADLAKALDYMKRNAGLTSITLAKGTLPFAGVLSVGVLPARLLSDVP
jgi:hypothetical protein